MLAFKAQPNDNTHEPAAIRNLSKKAIYDILANEFMLPTFKSRATSRKYLVGVYEKKYFAVKSIEIKRFLAELTADQLKKAPSTSNSEVFYKLSMILKENNQLPLGFDENSLPDSAWLYQVARCIDPDNTSGLFKVALNRPSTQTDSSRILAAQKAAEKYLLLDHNLLSHSEVHSQVKQLWETHKRFSCRQRELEVLQAHGQALTSKVDAGKLEVESVLLKTAMTVYTFGNQSKGADIILQVDNTAAREKVMEIKDM